MRAALLSALLLTGCSSSHTSWQVSAGSPPANAQVQVHSGGDLAAVFGLALIAGGIYAAHTDEGYWYSRRPPEMAPDRKVSEQDCTKPLDLTQGNIRCK